MLQLPQIKKQLEEIKGEDLSHQQIANMSMAWVSGESIQEIARKYFKGEDTDRITKPVKNMAIIFTVAKKILLFK